MSASVEEIEEIRPDNAPVTRADDPEGGTNTCVSVPAAVLDGILRRLESLEANQAAVIAENTSLRLSLASLTAATRLSSTTPPLASAAAPTPKPHLCRNTDTNRGYDWPSSQPADIHGVDGVGDSSHGLCLYCGFSDDTGAVETAAKASVAGASSSETREGPATVEGSGKSDDASACRQTPQRPLLSPPLACLGAGFRRRLSSCNRTGATSKVSSGGALSARPTDVCHDAADRCEGHHHVADGECGPDDAEDYRVSSLAPSTCASMFTTPRANQSPATVDGNDDDDDDDDEHRSTDNQRWADKTRGEQAVDRRGLAQAKESPSFSFLGNGPQRQAGAPSLESAPRSGLSLETFCEGMTIGSVSLTLTQELAKVMLDMRRTNDALDALKRKVSAEAKKRKALGHATWHQFTRFSAALKRLRGCILAVSDSAAAGHDDSHGHASPECSHTACPTHKEHFTAEESRRSTPRPSVPDMAVPVRPDADDGRPLVDATRARCRAATASADPATSSAHYHTVPATSAMTRGTSTNSSTTTPTPLLPADAPCASAAEMRSDGNRTAAETAKAVSRGRLSKAAAMACRGNQRKRYERNATSVGNDASKPCSTHSGNSNAVSAADIISAANGTGSLSLSSHTPAATTCAAPPHLLPPPVSTERATSSSPSLDTLRPENDTDGRHPLPVATAEGEPLPLIPCRGSCGKGKKTGREATKEKTPQAPRDASRQWRVSYPVSGQGQQLSPYAKAVGLPSDALGSTMERQRQVLPGSRLPTFSSRALASTSGATKPLTRWASRSSLESSSAAPTAEPSSSTEVPLGSYTGERNSRSSSSASSSSSTMTVKSTQSERSGSSRSGHIRVANSPVSRVLAAAARKPFASLMTNSGTRSLPLPVCSASLTSSQHTGSNGVTASIASGGGSRSGVKGCATTTPTVVDTSASPPQLAASSVTTATTIVVPPQQAAGTANGPPRANGRSQSPASTSLLTASSACQWSIPHPMNERNGDSCAVDFKTASAAITGGEAAGVAASTMMDGSSTGISDRRTSNGDGSVNSNKTTPTPPEAAALSRRPSVMPPPLSVASLSLDAKPLPKTVLVTTTTTTTATVTGKVSSPKCKKTSKSRRNSNGSRGSSLSFFSAYSSAAVEGGDKKHKRRQGSRQQHQHRNQHQHRSSASVSVASEEGKPTSSLSRHPHAGDAANPFTANDEGTRQQPRPEGTTAAPPPSSGPDPQHATPASAAAPAVDHVEETAGAAPQAFTEAEKVGALGEAGKRTSAQQRRGPLALLPSCSAPSPILVPAGSAGEEGLSAVSASAKGANSAKVSGGSDHHPHRAATEDLSGEGNNGSISFHRSDHDTAPPHESDDDDDGGANSGWHACVKAGDAPPTAFESGVFFSPASVMASRTSDGDSGRPEKAEETQTCSFLYDAAVTPVSSVVRKRELHRGKGSANSSGRTASSPKTRSGATADVIERGLAPATTTGQRPDTSTGVEHAPSTRVSRVRSEATDTRLLVTPAAATVAAAAAPLEAAPAHGRHHRRLSSQAWMPEQQKAAGGSDDGARASPCSKGSVVEPPQQPRLRLERGESSACAEKRLPIPSPALSLPADSMKRTSSLHPAGALSLTEESLEETGKRKVSFLYPSPHTADRERRKQEEEEAIRHVEEAILEKMLRRKRD